MPGGIINKTTILVFNNYTSMQAYIPSGVNRIGIDNSTGNYYIYNNSSWVLFRESIPYSKAGEWYPVQFFQASYAYTGSASQSMNSKNVIVETVNANVGNYTLIYPLNNFVFETIGCATGSYTSIYIANILTSVSTSLK